MNSFLNKNDLIKDLPKKVMLQIEMLLKNSTLTSDDESFQKLAEAWLTKRALFNKIIEHSHFKKAQEFSPSNPNGCIAITLSGSILSISPFINHEREITYSSIDYRKDVPGEIKFNISNIDQNIVTNKIVQFQKGRIKQTSEVIDLAYVDDDKDFQKQLLKINEVYKMLSNDFLQVDQLTFKANYIDNQLRNRNDLFKKWIILQWFILGGMDKHIFMARAKLLWLDLFTKLYKAVKDKYEANELKKLFLNFTNDKFAHFIDEYKWYESERKDFDIGLMKALEELGNYDNYQDFLNNYINELDL